MKIANECGPEKRENDTEKRSYELRTRREGEPREQRQRERR